MGKIHAENIRYYLPGIHLKAVADIKLDFDWARKLDIEVLDQDMNVILNDPQIDSVVIATPSSTHVDIICAAAQAGKHIFCEKPIAFNTEGIRKAGHAVTQAGVLFQVGFNRRFDPDFNHVHKNVKDGKIGSVQIIKITNRDPIRPDLAFIPDSGGLFMDFCIHDFDTVRFISGCEVKEIFVLGAALIDQEIMKLGDIDTALLTLTLSNGALCVIDVSRETNYGYDQQIEVFGSKGSVRAQNITPTRTVVSTADGVWSDKPHYSFIERYDASYKAELKSFFNSVRTGNSPTVGFSDALAAVKIANSAKQSFKHNKPERIGS
ncbi:MAG: inositol 2-dehydrogenase [Candidatus Marinimicrobia bacterium]|nr:inositol 2-dehydrogenase [Candidatus Neomarinimicrobiota bacterium]MCH7763434.1 inositol 2-dehydrogenase [Candidatus Neomarinimicrobiota bacterium]